MSQLTQQEKENILKNYIPQYIPCPPASHPNTCIKIPISYNDAGEVVDALHYIPNSPNIKNKGDKSPLYYVDWHSHELQKMLAEGYSFLDLFTLYVKDTSSEPHSYSKNTPIAWTQIDSVGNTSQGFEKSVHSIEPSSKPQFVFGAKRPNDPDQYANGNIQPPKPSLLTQYLYSFEFTHNGITITITTYLHDDIDQQKTLYTLCSLDDTHLISYPNPQKEGSFNTDLFNTSAEKPEYYLTSARGKLIQTAYFVSDSLNPLQTNQAR